MRRLAVLALAAAAAAQEPPHEPGADLRLYSLEGALATIPELVEGQTPNVHVLVPRVDLDEAHGDFGGLGDRYLSILTARLEVRQAGVHRFRLTSDDGSALYLDGTKALDHDGLHSATAVEVAVELEARAYALELRHFDNTVDSALRLEWKRPGDATFAVLDAACLSTPKGVVRVTSPGPKRRRREVVTAPGDRRPLAAVHPSYDLATVRPDGFEPRVGGLAFLPDGRLAVCCWEPRGGVYLLEGVHGHDRAAIRVKRVAEGLAEPLGLAAIGRRLFVLQKQELTELVDRDGDDVVDEYRCVADGWSVSGNFHEFAFGLVAREGWLHFNLAVAIDPGGRSTHPQAPDRGTSLRAHADTERVEFLATGLRTPNGVGLGPDGAVFLTDNQGDWLPCSKLVRLEPGAFYGSRAALPRGSEPPPPIPPVAWFPQNEIGNSPSQPGVFGAGPFDGQLVVGDVTHGGLKRVFLERVGDAWQGTLFRFTQGLEAGVNRLVALPDGRLFVGGIGSTGNWGQEGKLWHGLQRLTPNGEPSFEMLSVSARSNGLLVTLTEPLHPRCALGEVHVARWRYEPTAEYGGPKVDLKDLAPASVTTDGRRIFLELERVEPGHVYYVRLPELRSAGDRALWSTEAWTTLNAAPPERQEPFPARTVVPHGALTDAERAEGWRPLPAAAWRGFGQPDFPAEGWRGEDRVLVHDAGGGGGDLVTREEFGDVEFACEWAVAPGGNSGIFYLVSEDGPAVWATGPEMQVLDDFAHPDGARPETRAGALYGLLPCRRPAVRAAGSWNHARVRVEKGRVRHWLNGVLVVDYALGDERWAALKAASRFQDLPRFGENRRGRLALQDHGDAVSFRNLFARELP